MELKQFENIDRSELSMIEVAHAVLEETGDVYNFTELLVVVQEFLAIDEKTLERRMARFYTDMNVDGRFISLGENRWALRVWYPIDSIDEEIVNSIDDEDLPRRLRRKKRKLNAFIESDEMIDYNDDDPEDIDDIYDEVDEESYDINPDDEVEDEEEIDYIADEAIDDEEDNQELGVYARDLSELGEDDIELDDEDDVIQLEDEELDDEELDDEDLVDDDSIDEANDLDFNYDEDQE